MYYKLTTGFSINPSTGGTGWYRILEGTMVSLGIYTEVFLTNGYNYTRPQMVKLDIISSYNSAKMQVDTKYAFVNDITEYQKFRVVRSSDSSKWYLDIYFSKTVYDTSGSDFYQIKWLNNYTSLHAIEGCPMFYSKTDTLNSGEVLCCSADTRYNHGIFDETIQINGMDNCSKYLNFTDLKNAVPNVKELVVGNIRYFNMFVSRLKRQILVCGTLINNPEDETIPKGFPIQRLLLFGIDKTAISNDFGFGGGSSPFIVSSTIHSNTSFSGSMYCAGCAIGPFMSGNMFGIDAQYGIYNQSAVENNRIRALILQILIELN